MTTQRQQTPEWAYTIFMLLTIVILALMSSCKKEESNKYVVQQTYTTNGRYVLQNNTLQFERDTLELIMGTLNQLTNPSHYGSDTDMITVTISNGNITIPYHIGDAFPTFWISGQGQFTSTGMILDWESAHIDSSTHKTFHSIYTKL